MENSFGSRGILRKLATLYGPATTKIVDSESRRGSPTTRALHQRNNPFSRFEYAIASEQTRDYYYRKLKVFLEFMEIPKEPLSEGVNLLYNQIKEKGNDWFSDALMDYIVYMKQKVSSKQMVAGTLRNYYKPIRLFCSMNRIVLDWDMIARGIPSGRRAAMDRAPTLQEIHKVLEYQTDERIKPIVLLMVSTGIRIGAWEYLKWKHVTPIYNSNNDVLIAAKLIVYAGEPEQYFTFMTPEAYLALKEWMDFRSSYGEIITPDSWLMRNKWRKTHVVQGSRVGLAKVPIQIKPNGIKSLIQDVYLRQGVRPLLPKGEKRHEFKGMHGFRKYYKTVCEQVMKPANVELLIGHNLGISQSYYKPTESQLLEDYLKVVNALTIDKAFKLEEKLLEAKKENHLYRQQLEDFKELQRRVTEELKEIQSARNSKPRNDL